MERQALTGVLEHVNLHFHQGKGLSEAVRHQGLLLLKDLSHLQRGVERILISSIRGSGRLVGGGG